MCVWYLSKHKTSPLRFYLLSFSKTWLTYLFFFSVIIKLIPENVTELESTHLPHTKVNLLTLGSDEGKDSFYGIASSKERSFPGGLDSKESACDAGDLGSIPGSGRSSGERNGNPLQYSCLESSMDRGAWWATVHGVTKSWTNAFTFKQGEWASHV